MGYVQLLDWWTGLGLSLLKHTIGWLQLVVACLLAWHAVCLSKNYNVKTSIDC